MSALTDQLYDDVSWLADERTTFAGTDPSVHSVVVPDDALARFARQQTGDAPTPVTATITGGAGGLVALSGRSIGGIRLVAVEAMLRDLGDLPGAAARVLVAAESVDPAVTVYVGLPAVPGWERVVEPIESAGHHALVAMTDGPVLLARQLAALVETDLPFKIMSGPGRGAVVPVSGALSAVRALIDDADPVAAAELMMTAAGPPDAGEATRIRRRLRRLDVAGAVPESA